MTATATQIARQIINASSVDDAHAIAATLRGVRLAAVADLLGVHLHGRADAKRRQVVDHSIGAIINRSAIYGGSQRVQAWRERMLAKLREQEQDPAPAEQASDDVDQMVRMIKNLAPVLPGRIVPLAAIRAMVGGDRATQDAAFRRLHRMPGWTLIPEANQKMLAPEDHRAAVVVGDQARHLLAW